MNACNVLLLGLELGVSVIASMKDVEKIWTDVLKAVLSLPKYDYSISIDKFQSLSTCKKRF